MNHYEVLGVGPDATEQQIKEAYRREAMKWHPDRHDGVAAKGEADRRFKGLAVAYRTLRNAADRANYDRQLEQQLHREYNERLKEQARQQRAQDEKARQKQARQEPPKPDFADTGPQFEEQTASNDDANQMFYEQMLDLATELAGRGFPEFNIFKALVALGCPQALAKVVATAAAKPGSRTGTQEPEDDRDALAIDNFIDALWADIEPYFRAAIEGEKVAAPLSESRKKAVAYQRASRRKFWIGLGFVALLASEVRHLFGEIPVFAPRPANEFKDLPQFSGSKQKAIVVARCPA